MKKLSRIIIFASLILIFAQCEEKDDPKANCLLSELEARKNIISLTASEEYVYPLSLAIEDRASVLVQPKNALVSEFDFRKGVGGVYVYQSKNSFSGMDWVVLKVCRSAGGLECFTIDTLAFEFTIRSQTN